MSILNLQKFVSYKIFHLRCFYFLYATTISYFVSFIYIILLKFFRILATGTLVGTDDAIVVRKKLKLIGKPSEIYQKTAIIGGLFNSNEECLKFEGAKLQTVSGIRGIIKKRAKGPSPGYVRATFEDKITENGILLVYLVI